MIKLIIDKLPRILKNKKRLEDELSVRITNKGKEVEIDGESEDEYIAEKVIEALNLGFPYSDALEIKRNDFLFEVINIKDHTYRKDLERIRARIIGTKGKTFKTLSNLTNCCFELKGNSIGIIGSSEEIKNANDAIIHLIKGSKHANVYAYLERHHVKPIIDLGLKEKKRK